MLSIQANGRELRPLVDMESLSIANNLTSEIDTAGFGMQVSDRSLRPLTGEELVIYEGAADGVAPELALDSQDAFKTNYVGPNVDLDTEPGSVLLKKDNHSVAWDQLADFIGSGRNIDLVRVADQIRLRATSAPTFTRASGAYTPDGALVSSNVARYREAGRFGKAFVIEEPTTNLAPNPTFSGANGAIPASWADQYNNGKVGIDTSVTKFGNSVKFNNSDPASWAGLWTPGMYAVSNQNYTFSVWFKTSSGAQKCYAGIVYYNEAGTELGYDYPALSAGYPGTEWTRYSGTFNPVSKYPTCTKVGLRILGCYTSVGQAWAAAPQLEAKGYATTFDSGNRAEETLALPNNAVEATQGTVEGWFYLEDLGAHYSPLFSTANVNAPSPRLMLMREIAGAPNANRLCLWEADGANSYYNAGPVLAIRTWYHFALTWSPQGRKVYLDGALVIESAVGSPLQVSALRLGSWGVSSMHWLNGCLDDVRISSVVRTAEELAAAYASGVVLPVDDKTTYKLALDGNLKCGCGGYQVIARQSMWDPEPLACGLFTPTQQNPAGSTVRWHYRGARDVATLDAKGWSEVPASGLVEPWPIYDFRVTLLTDDFVGAEPYVTRADLAFSRYVAQAAYERRLDAGGAPAGQVQLVLGSDVPTGCALALATKTSADNIVWSEYQDLVPTEDPTRFLLASPPARYTWLRATLMASADGLLTSKMQKMLVQFARRTFGGRIQRVIENEAAAGQFSYSVEAADYTVELDQRLVVERYEGIASDAIVRDVLTKYCPTISVANIADGPVIEKVAFWYIPVSGCLQKLTQLTGYDWYVDYDRGFHWFPKETYPAPFGLTDAGDTYFGLSVETDLTQVRNRVFVRGGVYPSDPFSETIKGNGTARAWALLYKPHAIGPDTPITVTLNGVAKTLGIANIDDPATKDFLLNYQEKVLLAGSSLATPAATDTIVVTYRYEVPVRVQVDDAASQAALAALIGGDGILEHVIQNDRLLSREAAWQVGQADLVEHANPRVTARFSTRTPGLRAGQIIRTTIAKRELDRDFLITSVTKSPERFDPESSDYAWAYEVSCETRVLGLESLLIELLDQTREIEDADEVLDRLVNTNVNLALSLASEVITEEPAGNLVGDFIIGKSEVG